MKIMRITIIAVVGILSYLLILLPGYFLFVSGDAEKPEASVTSTEKTDNTSVAKLAEKPPLANPGEAPPLK